MGIHAEAVREDEANWLKKIFLILINILFFAWYCLFSIVTGVLVLPPNYVYHRAWKPGRHQLAARRFIRIYARGVIRLSWPLVRIEIKGLEQVQGAEPCVYVLNHYSFVDVFFCGYLPAYHTVVAVRSWPFKIPVLNIFMRIAGYMDVEKNSWKDTLTYAAETMNAGGCILFFPEGHRSKNGQMSPLGKGAFRIAAENDVPVVPVALEGTEYLGGYKSRLLSPCRVTMRFFPPMKAEGSDFAAVNELRRRVEDLYQREVYDKKT
jgi:1-acyl-sn-glycerol-3-phosphate acyltransferase